MTENNKLHESWQECALIISGARRRAGLGALQDSALQAEASEWAAILAGVPARRLQDAATYAFRSRTVKGLLQPGEVLAAWQSMRQSEAANAPPAFLDARPGPPLCRYCEDSGYQALRMPAELGYAEGRKNLNTYFRPCACPRAPFSQKTAYPLREPLWTRLRPSMLWERVS